MARILSERLEIPYIDTGAFYRCVAYYKKKNPYCNESCLEEFARTMEIRFQKDKTGQKVILNGKDVSQKIRTASVAKIVSLIASMDNIRKILNIKLREAGNRRGGILEGRDIQTLVFPNADLKFYLTASIEERAKRRMKDYIKLGEDISMETLVDKIKARDKSDIGRDYGPLKKAEDGIEIDTTDLSLDEVIGKIINFMKKLDFK